MAATAVLFDLDGTLTDSLPFIRHCNIRVFEEMGIPWGNDDVMRWIGRPMVDIARHFARERHQIFIDTYMQYYHREHDKYIALFPGTMEMLEKLKDMKLSLGIVTSKGRSGTIRTLDYTGLDKYMDVVVTAHDVEKHKPNPEPVLKAMDTLACLPAQTVFVGDSYFDIRAGKAAGARTLGVTWGMALAYELQECEPDGLLNTWGEIYDYV